MGGDYFGLIDAPGIGERHPQPCPVCRSGDYARVVSIPVVNREYQAGRNKYPYRSYRHGHLDGCRRDGDGHCIIESAGHEREVMAKNDLIRE